MSRVRVSLTEWRDEGPRTPYTPTIRYSGSLALPVTGKLMQIRIVTPAERERVARNHAAYNARHRQLQRLTPRQREILAAVVRHDGNRSRAARELRMTVSGVQCSLRRTVAAGIDVPAGARRGPDRHQRPSRAA